MTWTGLDWTTGHSLEHVTVRLGLERRDRDDEHTQQTRQTIKQLHLFLGGERERERRSISYEFMPHQ